MYGSVIGVFMTHGDAMIFLKLRLHRIKYRVLDAIRWFGEVTGIRARKETRALSYVLSNAAAGDANSVLAALDRFATDEAFLMNLGPDKLKMLDDVFVRHEISTAIELGAYCGYSAVAIAMRLPRGGVLISVEISPRMAGIARQIIEHAGLSDVVDVRVGTAADVVGSSADLLLLDHAKDVYLDDLLLLEPTLNPQAVVFADNTGLFPELMAPYLSHVRSQAYASSLTIVTTMEYRPDVYDEVEISVRN
jgi:catechol O-methyltransferase